MDDNKPTVFIYITDCEEGGNLLNKALRVYLINLSKNDKDFNYLKILNEQDAIKGFNVKEDNGERLVVITNLNSVGSSDTILNKINSMAEKKIFIEKYKKKFHLVCLTDEKETLLHKLFSKKKNYNNENIGSSLLLLKYMDSVRALTFWNVFSDKFTTQIKDFFEPQENGDRIFEQKCSLEGFYELLKICNETNKKITDKYLIETAKEIDGNFNAKVESSILFYLARLYKDSKTGNLSLGGHEVRRDFYNQFSIPKNNEEIDKRKDIDKHNNDIVTNTKRMMFMLFARDWARNIADNVWNRVKKYNKENKEINILIIDDQPQHFREEIKQLCKCFPKVRVKFYITEDYKKFIDQLNHFGNDEENMDFEVDCYDYCETKTCNQKVLLEKFSFVFIDLLLGTENLGFNIIKRLSRLKIEENEKNKEPKLKYDIFVLSLSTNTNDIQTALNKGAIGYIFKERIFSIPYRICEVLLEPGKEEHDLLSYISPFSGLNMLPLKIIQKLKSSPFENTEENRKWIKEIPKADLHCHIGGAMDAEITLELAVNIFRDTIRAYLLTESFVYLNGDSIGQNPLNLPKDFFEKGALKKLKELTKRAARRLFDDIEKKTQPKLKKHIEWITGNVSGIKKHQVICFILIQLAVIAEQKW